jgi:protein-L-isoaspartate O-methyltransferase
VTPELAKKVSAEAFEARYSGVTDPWAFETSPYEQHRYTTILRALSRSKYKIAYEPGCSVGSLTAKLALVAERVIATDIAQSAVNQAEARCAKLSNVEVFCADVATYIPPLPPDLIVFSEIGYYFDFLELRRVAASLAARLQRQGEFVAVHWLGRSEDHVQHGDDVHDFLRSVLPLRWIKGDRHENFRIDCWVRP